MIINLNTIYISKYNPYLETKNKFSKNVLIKKVFLKKYIYMYLILKTIFDFKKNSISIKKLKKNWYTFLKSPNRHKKHQAHVFQQFFIIKINLYMLIKTTNNLHRNYVEFFNFISNLFIYESNLYTLKNIKFNIITKVNLNEL